MMDVLGKRDLPAIAGNGHRIVLGYLCYNNVVTMEIVVTEDIEVYSCSWHLTPHQTLDQPSHVTCYVSPADAGIYTYLKKRDSIRYIICL